MSPSPVRSLGAVFWKPAFRSLKSPSVHHHRGKASMERGWNSPVARFDAAARCTLDRRLHLSWWSMSIGTARPLKQQAGCKRPASSRAAPHMSIDPSRKETQAQVDSDSLFQHSRHHEPHVPVGFPFVPQVPPKSPKSHA